MKSISKTVRLSLTVLAAALVVVDVGLWFRQIRHDRYIDLSKSVIPDRHSAVPPNQPRPIYRHSVVPGGIFSAAELREAMAADRIVAAHYSGIDPDRMRAVRLIADRLAFVSFRSQDATYWTTRKLRLLKGELLLTDGEHWVRGRCGNRIAFAPQKPFLPPADEPPTRDFDEPPTFAVRTFLPAPGLDPLPPFPVEAPSLTTSSAARQRSPRRLPLQASAPRPRSDEPLPSPLTEVPEASTTWLVAGGLSLIVGIKAFRRPGRK